MMDSIQGQNWQTVMPDGIVIDNNDPLQAGRIKVRVLGLHDGVPDDHLPWAVNGNPSGRGPNAQAASVRIPIKGSRVKVNFQQGDPTNPEYFGGVTSGATVPSVFKTNYPNRSGEFFPNGTHWYLDEVSNTFYFFHQGFFCTIDSGGNLQIQSGTVNINSQKVDWAAAGPYKTSAPNITNDAPTTQMTGQTNSANLITGQNGIAVSGGAGGNAGVMHGNLRIINGDVNADGWTLKGHRHNGRNGITSSAIPG